MGITETGGQDGYGGAEGDRTPDLRNAIATLSQLSYGPIPSGRQPISRRPEAWQVEERTLAGGISRPTVDRLMEVENPRFPRLAESIIDPNHTTTGRKS